MGVGEQRIGEYASKAAAAGGGGHRRHVLLASLDPEVDAAEALRRKVGQRRHLAGPPHIAGRAVHRWLAAALPLLLCCQLLQLAHRRLQGVACSSTVAAPRQPTHRLYQAESALRRPPQITHMARSRRRRQQPIRRRISPIPFHPPPPDLSTLPPPTAPHPTPPPPPSAHTNPRTCARTPPLLAHRRGRR